MPSKESDTAIFRNLNFIKKGGDSCLPFSVISPVGFIFACMKRMWIWIVGALVGLGFLGLLGLQGWYTSMMVKMRKDQFDENVKRSLDLASRDLERSETAHYLERVISPYSDDLLLLDSTQTARSPKVLGNPELLGILAHDSVFHTSGLRNKPVAGQITHMPLTLRLNPGNADAISQSAAKFQRAVRNAYVYQKGVLDEVIYTILYNASEKTFEERINPQYLDACIRMALERNGVTIPYHFKVCTSDGREVYQCSDYDCTGSEYSYTQTLFRNDPSQKMGFVRVHFPEQSKYVLGVLNMMLPSMIFTIILFITFVLLLYLVVRQRKVTEMKNDFVNNMTHEFKTPIASISLAAQMLADNTITKSPQMYENLGNVISAESRRLRFQVEKVLQMSLYEHKSIALKPVELNADELIDSVVNTFSLKVEQSGGSVETHLEAENPLVSVDEMHFTNVVFNLLENAVKYRRDDEPLRLVIRTRNYGDRYVMSIRDNGIGIRREDLRRIFDKFFRVHTGDQHNVKGFGLGLAYVKKMIDLHRGSIKAESEYGKWTRFIINLPTSKD